MILGVVSVLLGLLALVFVWWLRLPTATLAFGLPAVAAGLVGRRHLASGADQTRALRGQRLSNVGTLLGTAAIVATLIFVLLTTDF